MKMTRTASMARKRAMLEDARMNPRNARKLYEEEDEEIEVEADAVAFDEEDDDIESQTVNLIKAMKADGMLANVSIEDESEEGDEEPLEEDEDDLMEESARKNRAQRIAEAKARIARRRILENRRKAAVTKQQTSPVKNRAQRIAEAKARIARRRILENRRRSMR